MKKSEELKVRLRERMRIYQDSPGVAASYIDLKHITEDLIKLVDDKEDSRIGFNGKSK